MREFQKSFSQLSAGNDFWRWKAGLKDLMVQGSGYAEKNTLAVAIRADCPYPGAVHSTRSSFLSRQLEFEVLKDL